MYSLNELWNCIAIVNSAGEIVETFDFNERHEAYEVLLTLNE